MRFLASYARLACWTLEHGRIRYPLMPKIHYLHHAFRTMLLEATHLVWVPNALGTSVQLDEDFVGRVARISRRVGSGLLMQRTLERYLVAANLALFPEERKQSEKCIHFSRILRRELRIQGYFFIVSLVARNGFRRNV